MDLAHIAKVRQQLPALEPRLVPVLSPLSHAELVPAMVPLLWSQASGLTAQQVPVRCVALAADAAAGPQVLVLTDAVEQGPVDLAVHALGAHPAVVGPVVALRVEDLE